MRMAIIGGDSIGRSYKKATFMKKFLVTTWILIGTLALATVLLPWSIHIFKSYIDLTVFWSALLAMLIIESFFMLAPLALKFFFYTAFTIWDYRPWRSCHCGSGIPWVKCKRTREHPFKYKFVRS
jgi:hypothetical protein